MLSLHTVMRGSASDPGKHQRTDAVMEAALLEQSLRNHAATFVGVDLNNDLDQVPTVTKAMQEGHWFDVAAFPHLWRQWQQLGAGEDARASLGATCWAHGAKHPTKRDYLLTNRRGLQMMQAFALGPWGVLDVHRPVALCLRKQTPARIRRNKKLMPMLPEEKDLEEWFQPMEPHADTHTNPSTRREKGPLGSVPQKSQC